MGEGTYGEYLESEMGCQRREGSIMICHTFLVNTRPSLEGKDRNKLTETRTSSEAPHSRHAPSFD